MIPTMDAVLLQTALSFAFSGTKGFNPVLSYSEKWVRWRTNVGPSTCTYCAEQNGKIFEHKELPPQEPPVHERCKCEIEKLLAILAGTATIDGDSGADYLMRHLNVLPDNYVSKQSAIQNGWKNNKGNLWQVMPGSNIGGDVFFNSKGKLPNFPGRIWYEADINYTGGYRNSHRLLYSNDGLIFATYDHFKTFYEIN